MPTIVFRFPAGRYHATPWGSHVNEGLIEWPPSPWRILRALLATGYSKLGWQEAPAGATELIESLATVLPDYTLPPAVASHTRHFMPKDSKKPEDRSKVFDAFAQVGKGGEIAVHWRATLSQRAESLLGELVPRMSYLGRAESVVDGRLADATEVHDGEMASATDVNRPGAEPIWLLAPLPPENYASWVAEAEGSGPAVKKGKKSAAVSPYPADFMAAMQVDTEFLQEHGWTQPPGSRRVLYYRSPPKTGRAAPLRRTPSPARPTTALLALSSDTQTREVLPRMHLALRQMDTIHKALLSKLDGETCPELTGRADGGRPLEGHRHATLLPLDVDGDGMLDHVLVHAPMGLGVVAQRALRRLTAIYSRDLRVFVTLVGDGDLEKFAMLGGRGALPEIAASKSWESRTPFVPPRHIKPRRHALEDQIRAELASRGLPTAVRVVVFERDALVNRGFHRFVRTRGPGHPPPVDRFFGVRIELESPVRGPLTLGYGSHFGLGVFVPAQSEPR